MLRLSLVRVLKGRVDDRRNPASKRTILTDRRRDRRSLAILRLPHLRQTDSIRRPMGNIRLTGRILPMDNILLPPTVNIRRSGRRMAHPVVPKTTLLFPVGRKLVGRSSFRPER